MTSIKRFCKTWWVAWFGIILLFGTGANWRAGQSSSQDTDTFAQPTEGTGHSPLEAGEEHPPANTDSAGEATGDELDRAAIDATGLSELELARLVHLEPNPATTSLSSEPAPFTVRQQVVDQARLWSNRPLSFEALHRLIRGNQLSFRADACDRAALSGDARLIPILIDALSDESMHEGAEYAGNSGLWTTRRRCHLALLQLTGESFGYHWNDPPATRELAIARWRTWFSSSALP